MLVYNTFPVPDLNSQSRERLAKSAIGILAAREQFPGSTLAELYDPDGMPQSLRQAHRELDEEVDQLYRKLAFDSDDDRLRMLFAMYESSPETVSWHA